MPEFFLVRGNASVVCFAMGDEAKTNFLFFIQNGVTNE